MNPPAMVLLFSPVVVVVVTGAGGVSPVAIVLGIERPKKDTKSIVTPPSWAAQKVMSGDLGNIYCYKGTAAVQSHYPL